MSRWLREPPDHQTDRARILSAGGIRRLPLPGGKQVPNFDQAIASPSTVNPSGDRSHFTES
jgi:hypothetical protein